MTFDDLRQEYAEETIGPLIWDLIVELAGLIASRYPPGIYNRGASWGESSVEEVAQETAVDLLLAEGQIHYIFAVASGVEDVRRLLVRNVKRALWRRRGPTVVDRLMRRVRRIAAELPYARQKVGGSSLITLVGAAEATRDLRESELRAVAAAAHSVPRLMEREGAERASMVYTPSALRELLALVVEMTGGVSERDLARIFEILLTAWLPTSLVVDDDGELADVEQAEAGVERTEMQAAVRDFVSSLEPVDTTVLVGKAQGLSDEAVSQRLGRSRPWVASRKKALLDRLDSELRPALDETLENEAAWLLMEQASATLGEDPP